MRVATLTWSAAVDGAGVVAVIEKAEFGAWSNAPDNAKSAANISLVRFADERTSCSVELEIGAVVAISRRYYGVVISGKRSATLATASGAAVMHSTFVTRLMLWAAA